MKEAPNILEAKTMPDRQISIRYSDGTQSTFNFESYFSYTGYYTFLKNIESFLKINIHQNNNYVFWINEQGEEIEIDSAVLYAICTQQKIIIDGKIVFDPALGKEAWI